MRTTLPVQMLGKYELRGIIGRGAAGTVYSAWDTRLDRRVAIKAVRLPDLSEDKASDVLTRFRQEARIAAQLDHSGIVGVYDDGESDGLAYIVMEFVEGETLKALLDRKEPIDIERAMDIMRQMLAALGHCHARGIVHRDLKPSNLMISQDGQVKLTDFGVARIGTSDLTLEGTLIGTPGYMSPEQFTAKKPAEPRTDIYASGVICYELLTGQRPFDGNLEQIAVQVLTSLPAPPSELVPSLPVGLDRAVLRAMAKNPEERFETAEAFSMALRAAMSSRLDPTPGLDPGDATIAMVPPGTPHKPMPLPAFPRTISPERPVGARWGIIGGLGGAGILGVVVILLLFARPGHSPGPAPPSTEPAASRAPTSDNPPPEGARFPVPGTTIGPKEPAIVVPPPPTPPPPSAGPVTIVPPAPTFAPPAPPVLPILQRADLAAAIATLTCSTVSEHLQNVAPQLVVSGLIGAGAPRAALDAIVSRFSIAGVRDEVTTFPATPPFCLAADITRSVAAATPDGTFSPILAGDTTRLMKGDQIRLKLQMPDFDGEIRVDYLTNDGTTIFHAEPRTGMPRRRAANTSPGIGPNGDGLIGTVSPPYGIDMILVVVSSQPLFPVPRLTNPEASEVYLNVLQAAINDVRRQGGQVSVGLLRVETVER